MNFQFFSTPKPKKFNYKPRFQKPENEEETQNDKEKETMSLPCDYTSRGKSEERKKSLIHSLLNLLFGAYSL